MGKILSDKEKLAQILRFFGLKIVDFAEKIGVIGTNIYSVNQDKAEFFNRETLEGIAKNCPEISPYWLITGEGSMLGGVVEQHNINGDNLNNSQKSTIPVHIVETLTDTNASQQRTIENLVTLLKK